MIATLFGMAITYPILYNAYMMATVKGRHRRSTRWGRWVGDAILP